jgi:hypothetical protein
MKSIVLLALSLASIAAHAETQTSFTCYMADQGSQYSVNFTVLNLENTQTMSVLTTGDDEYNNTSVSVKKLADQKWVDTDESIFTYLKASYLSFDDTQKTLSFALDDCVIQGSMELYQNSGYTKGYIRFSDDDTTSYAKVTCTQQPVK